jgi:hypothetical protein
MSPAMKTSVLILLAVIAVVTLAGWVYSWREARLKDQALFKYQLESKQAIAEANKAISIANQRAAEASLELARLQTKMLPRRLNQAQQQELSAAVRALAPQLAGVWYGAGDKESETFAWDIASALDAAGWKVFSPASTSTLAESRKPFGTLPRLQTGVMVSSNKDPASMKAADALATQIAALGFDTTKAADIGTGREPLVVVTVEARPDGPQGEMKLNAAGK